MTVRVQTEPAFSAGNPEVVIETPYYQGQVGRFYDISPDGERFLMIKEESEGSSSPEIHVVLNWFEELKRLVPVQ